MKRIYLSGRFSQQADFKVLRQRIHKAGLGTVTSSWLDQTGPEPATREAARLIAERDLADVRNSNLAILDFSLPPRGGREVEFGAFLALETECWVVNNQNAGNVFTAIPALVLPDWDAALAELFKATYEH